MQATGYSCQGSDVLKLFLSFSSFLPPCVTTFLKTDPQPSSLLVLYIILSGLILLTSNTTYNTSNANPNSNLVVIST